MSLLPSCIDGRKIVRAACRAGMTLARNDAERRPRRRVARLALDRVRAAEWLRRSEVAVEHLLRSVDRAIVRMIRPFGSSRPAGGSSVQPPDGSRRAGCHHWGVEFRFPRARSGAPRGRRGRGLECLKHGLHRVRVRDREDARGERRVGAGTSRELAHVPVPCALFLRGRPSDPRDVGPVDELRRTDSPGSRSPRGSRRGSPTTSSARFPRRPGRAFTKPRC